MFMKKLLLPAALLAFGITCVSADPLLLPIPGVTATTDATDIVEGSATNLVDGASLEAGPSTVLGASDSLSDDGSTGGGPGYAITRGLLLGGSGDSVVFNLGGTFNVSDLLVWNFSQAGFWDVGANSVSVATSTDGVTYTSPVDITFPENATNTTQGEFDVSPFIVPVDLTGAKYVELTFNSNYGNSSGLIGVNAISFVEAPEPSTYAMLLAGVVLLGVGLRRRGLSLA